MPSLQRFVLIASLLLLLHVVRPVVSSNTQTTTTAPPTTTDDRLDALERAVARQQVTIDAQQVTMDEQQVKIDAQQVTIDTLVEEKQKHDEVEKRQEADIVALKTEVAELRAKKTRTEQAHRPTTPSSPRAVVARPVTITTCCVVQPAGHNFVSGGWADSRTTSSSATAACRSDSTT